MAIREELLKQALSLPTEERAELARRLLDSLDASTAGDEDDAAEPGWAPELTQRAMDMVTGRERGLDFEDVMSQIEARLRGQ